jgi:hypothetical protein
MKRKKLMGGKRNTFELRGVRIYIARGAILLLLRTGIHGFFFGRDGLTFWLQRSGYCGEDGKQREQLNHNGYTSDILVSGVMTIYRQTSSCGSNIQRK